MKVLLLNAYARSNAGDGLLVDLTAEAVRECFPDADINLISMDPASFEEFPRGINPVSGASSSMSKMQLLRVALTRRPHRLVRDEIDGADLAIAVGGGYLRADTPLATAKSVLSHVVQAPTRRTSTPYVYMPQSIGPLPSRWVGAGFGRLRRATSVHVRDDRSLAQLNAYRMNGTRSPDLVVMAIAKEWSDRSREHLPHTGSVGVVLRAIHKGGRRYEEKASALLDLSGAVPLVQSAGRGNDDPAFYQLLGHAGPHLKLTDALSDPYRRPEVTVSVRLHGSLQSILAGVPSIHLSYERKGWGAYKDLGIERFVHHAWTFDAGAVRDQVEELRADPQPYWDAVEQAIPSILVSREKLLADIRTAPDHVSTGMPVEGPKP